MTKVTHLTLNESGELSRRRIHLREISDEADSPLETVGQHLRAARLRRGDDLATVSKSLKIRKDHLEALEEDRFDSLPGRTYVVGFIRSYAEYLGLDPVQSVERYKREVAGRAAEPEQATISAVPSDERRLPQGWLVIAVFVLALVGYGAYHLLNSADTLLQQPVDSVPSRIAPKAAQPAAQPTPPPVNAAVEPAPAQGLPYDNSGAVGMTLQPDGQTATEPGQASATQPGTVPDAAPPAPEALPQGTVYGRLNRNSRVTIRITEPTRLLVEGDDGTVYINRSLKPGDTYLVPDAVGLSLTTQNAGAIELVLDGQPMGHAGLPRQVMESLSLDPQAIVDRYNRGRSG